LIDDKKNIMKILRLPILAFSMLAIFSCSTEESILQDENITEITELNADLSLYDGLSQGLYKGVFSTADSETRATVEIKVISDTRANALTIDTDGVVEFYEGTVQESVSSTGNMQIAFASPRSSFNFSVSDLGENPIITDAISNNKPSFVTVVKEANRDAVTPVTGTYTTNDGTVTGTWSIIFNSGDDEDVNMDITTQTIFDGRDFGSTTGSSQAACVAVGNKADCPITGSYTSQGVAITWSGVHTFLNRNDCSSVEGMWSTDNGLQGTFMGDSNCNGTGEVIITEIHNRPQRPSADEMIAAIPNNPGSPGNADLRGNGEGQELHTEWFEVFNTTNSPVVMDGWVFTDASGGSRTFTVSNFTLGAGEYAAFTGYNIPAAQGGVVFDYIYTYNEMSFNNESSYTNESMNNTNCPDGVIITDDNNVLVDQVLYDYGYGEYIDNVDNGDTRCNGNDVAIGFPGQNSNSRVSFQLVNDPATMNAADNDDAANWSFSTNEYDADNGQDGTPGAANDPRI